MSDIEFETYYDELRIRNVPGFDPRKSAVICFPREARCQAEAFLRLKGAWKE